MAPRTHYARSGDANIAYQVHGQGPVDVLFSPGILSHLEHLWEEPGLSRLFDRVARFARLILLDRRGSGLSDPVSGPLTLEQELDDVSAVLDAAGSERAALFGYTTSGPLLSLYAARRPERVRALVLYATIARAVADDDVSWARSAQERQAALDEMLAQWGEGSNIDRVAPSAAGDQRLREWYARLERLAASPGTMRLLSRNVAEADAREALAEIRVPTLVLHRTDDQLIDVRHSRYLAERIPGARLVELPGRDSLPSLGDTEALVAEVEELLTGGRSAREPERALLTVLFTDIVAGTATAAELGDRRWRDLLAAHDAAVRRELRRHGGEDIKTTGDGFLAVFGGPPSHAVRCARAIVTAAAALGIEVRAGLHTGECEVIGDDVGGMAVHIAARIVALAGAGEVLVSQTLVSAVTGSGLQFADRGAHALKGVPGRWALACSVG